MSDQPRDPDNLKPTELPETEADEPSSPAEQQIGPYRLLDKLGEECHPLQFLRELTQNALEAIQKLPEPTGEIVWDVDWTAYQYQPTGRGV